MVKNGDQWSVSDLSLYSVYKTIVDQGLLDITFWEGHVRSFPEFEQFAKADQNTITFILRDGEAAGLAWLGPIHGNYAFGHFCLFKEIWGKKATEAGKLVLDYWFWIPGKDRPLFDVIIGLMPMINKRAHKYIDRIGFTLLGVIPGMFRRDDVQDDAVVYYKTRGQHG